MFPGFFPEAKHNHYTDFGYPADVTFDQLYGTYSRNSVAKAAVGRTVAKTWETNPLLQEEARDGQSKGKAKPETRREALIRQRFDDLRFWQRLAEADRRSLVGRYAGVILRIADDKTFDQPVDAVTGGLDALVEIIPAWEGQLQVSQWDTNETSPTYGQPTMYLFQEAVVGDVKQPRSLTIHPDRVVIWSEDGTLNGRSALEAGYNDLMDIEKVRGGGAEGFWKNAKSAPILETMPGTTIKGMADAMGIKPDELADKMNEQVESFNQGFDKLLMLQGMTVKPSSVTLPASPEQYFMVPAQCFASSFSIPLKILLGSQSGERASTEDASEWSRTNMARRTNVVVPAIMTVIGRLERFGILPERDWHLDWTDLTVASATERMERVGKMAEANFKQSRATGERVFTTDEMRAVDDKEPLSGGAAITKPGKGETDPTKDDPPKPGAPAPADPPAEAA